MVALTSELGRGRAQEGNETGRINDAPTCPEPLSKVYRVVSHGLDSIFATPPNTLQVNLHRQIPANDLS